jgi:galactokinase
MSDYLLKTFQDVFTETNYDECRYFRAPGRINIIGEHVDYLGGKVLPAAINYYIHTILAPNHLDNIRLYSMQYKEFIEVSKLELKPTKFHWANYVVGVVQELQKKGFSVGGFDMVIDGNIPEGAGLSSSAALEVVVGYAMKEVFQLPLDKKEIALVGQAAENHFIGVNCGIMDQFASALGRKDSCILLDTGTLEYSYHRVSFPEHQFYLINSMVKHSLKDSGYNQRRENCESALRKIQQAGVALNHLYSFDGSIDDPKYSFSEVEKKRISHLMGEKLRTKKVLDSLQSKNVQLFGNSLYETHESLSNLFEVSCLETDFIVSVLKSMKVTGARMIGGGFGGCVLVIDSKGNFQKNYLSLVEKYEEHFSIHPEVIRFDIADGVTEIQ